MRHIPLRLHLPAFEGETGRITADVCRGEVALGKREVAGRRSRRPAPRPITLKHTHVGRPRMPFRRTIFCRFRTRRSRARPASAYRGCADRFSPGEPVSATVDDPIAVTSVLPRQNRVCLACKGGRIRPCVHPLNLDPPDSSRKPVLTRAVPGELLSQEVTCYRDPTSA